MNYCNKCILPDTRPGLVLNKDGVCNGCLSSEQKNTTINWEEREKDFHAVVENAKNNSSGYDCIIPVSGGKDSTWQVIKCLEYGLKPLAVTWKTPARTSIGQQNLENLVGLGVDHIDYQINPNVEKKLMLIALEKFGTTALPMHLALFNIPITVAVNFKVPLIVWGENSAFEYGGDEKNKGFLLDSSWLKQHGVTHGTSANYWVSDNLSKKDLTPYFGPTDDEMNKMGIRAVFLGYYFNWDPEESLKIARENGFKVRSQGPKLGYYNYADIDCDFISVHHYIKWYKFGITRLFDNLSLEIRNGRISRNEALEILKLQGEQRPDGDIEKVCEFMGISRERFYIIIEKYRNREIWTEDKGKWRIKDFIIDDWNWK